MSTQPIEGACSALPRQSQTNPLQTRAGSAGRPSPVVGGGAQTPDPNEAEVNEISRIGSDYDSETAELVRLLLASGFTPSTLAVALTVDDDTLRRWRRGVRASHLARKLMRCMLVLRKLAKGKLATISMGTPQELVDSIDDLDVRYLTPADVARENMTREQRMMTWRDGAEGGGL